MALRNILYILLMIWCCNARSVIDPKLVLVKIQCRTATTTIPTTRTPTNTRLPTEIIKSTITSKPTPISASESPETSRIKITSETSRPIITENTSSSLSRPNVTSTDKELKIVQFEHKELILGIGCFISGTVFGIILIIVGQWLLKKRKMKKDDIYTHTDIKLDDHVYTGISPKQESRSSRTVLESSDPCNTYVNT